MPINLENINATFSNAKLGKDGVGEGAVVRLDCKFSFICHGSKLPQFITLSEGVEPLKMLWNGEQPLEGLHSLNLNSQIEHNRVAFEGHSGLVELQNCTVKKINIRPISGALMDVTLTAQARNLTEHQIKLLADNAKGDGELTIVSDPDLFDQETEQSEEV